MKVDAAPRGAAHHPAVLRRSLGALDALGEAVDPDLVAQDVRLTMGGEPTFVSIDDMDAPEWNTAAVGADQAARAEDLIRRLRERFAPGGLLHFGQGKWYPGESLPRWAFSLYLAQGRRADLAQSGLIDGGGGASRRRPPQGAALRRGDWRRGSASIPTASMPAYEDPPHWLQKEAALPVNVDPADPKIDDPEERARMVRTFERGLSQPTGFVLPLQRWNARAAIRAGAASAGRCGAASCF